MNTGSPDALSTTEAYAMNEPPALEVLTTAKPLDTCPDVTCRKTRLICR
jgi:hypothetical protein